MTDRRDVSFQMWLRMCEQTVASVSLRVHHPTSCQSTQWQQSFSNSSWFLFTLWYPCDICRKALFCVFGFCELPCHLNALICMTPFSASTHRLEGGFKFKSKVSRALIVTRHFNLHHGISGSHWLHFLFLLCQAECGSSSRHGFSHVK